MRDLAISNAAYWIEEFHFDGLRLDATQNIYDDSDDNVIAALGRAARKAAGARSIILIAENEPQNSDLVRPPDDGGYGLDGVWNDDLHHTAMVAATGRNEFYYQDFEGTPQEFISAAKYGYLFQGQTYASSNEPRGVLALDLKPDAFVTFVQNHDQIANSAQGLRLHQLTSPARARAITALSILMPGTPMLFQGQEFWASAPFLYFADHRPELAKLVRKGRHDYLANFPSIATPSGQKQLADPEADATFEACKLDWSEVETQRQDRGHAPRPAAAAGAPTAPSTRIIAPRPTAPSWGRTPSRCGFSRRPATTACSSSTSAATSTARASPNP